MARVERKHRRNNENSSYALEGFSVELDSQLNKIKSLKRKAKEEKQFILPSIKPIKRKNLNQEKWAIPKIESKANEIQLRINKLQRNNMSFMDLKRYPNLMMEEESQEPRLPPPPQIIIPPPQYVPIVFMNLPYGNGNYDNYPSHHSRSHHNSQRRQSDSPRKKSQSSRSSTEKKKAPPVFSESKKQFLRKKLKVAFLAVYFIFIYKTYFKSIIYRKCLNYFQIEEIIATEYEGVQNDIYKVLVSANLFEQFYRISKDIQNRQEGSKVEKVQFEDEQITISPLACQEFIKFLLNHVEQSIKNGELGTLNPILANLVYGGFPFSNFYLSEELKLLNINTTYGYLTITPEVSKMLMINFIFIKVIIYQLLGKKQLLNILYKVYRKKPEQKKFTLFYGKKLTMTLILFYQSLNSVFFSGTKKIASNYESLPQILKVEQMAELQYELIINKEDTKSKSKKIEKCLIKNVICPQNLKSIFINGFEDNWLKIKKIAELLYSQAQDYKLELLKEIKIQSSFPDRNLLNNLPKFKHEKILELQDDGSNYERTQSENPSSQGQSRNSKSSLKLESFKSKLNKKKKAGRSSDFN